MNNPPNMRLPTDPGDNRIGVRLDDTGSRPVEQPLADRSETLELLEETIQVSKRDVRSGLVRVSTHTESFEETAEITLDRSVVDVERVPIGLIVDVAPTVRTEGDTTIVPVVEERFVVVKQLYLKEELHIRRRVETEVSRTPVVLRRQIAVVERIGADGHVNAEDAKPKA